jgi:hypothetical protein
MKSMSLRPTQEFAVNWTDEERGVWKTIETHWGHITKGEVEQFLNSIHPEFTGFGHESPLLIDKESIKHWVGFWGKNINIPIYELQPLYVKAYDSFAIVHYYLLALEMHGGQGKRFTRRYSSTLKKENGKWLVVANQNALMPSDW